MPAEYTAEAIVRKPPRIEISPLEISIANRAEVTIGFAYLYLSDDQELGKFELTLKATDKTLVLTGNSALDLHIPADLQTAEQLKRVRLTTESAGAWKMTQVDGGLHFTLQPGASLKVTRDLPVKIGLEGMLAAGEAEIKRDLTFSWKGFEGVDDDYRLFAVRSILLRKIRAEIECTWLQREEYFEGGGAFVYYTPYEPTTQLPGIRNRLILSLENKGDALIGEQAEFTVIFPTEEYGDTRSALCFTEQLKVVECARYGTGRAWRVIRVADGDVTYWRILPPSGDKLVLGSKETVTFEFTNLVTQLRAGEARAQVHWSSLEKVSAGYASTFLLKREPTPYLRELYMLDASGRKLGAAEGLYFGETYKLCWDTFAADRCEIESTPEGKFTARSFFEFKADQVSRRFKVTPQIVDKDGSSRSQNRALRAAEAVLRQTPIREGALESVLLEWETRGGVAWLGSVHTPRSRRSPAGSETVRVNDAYTLQVDTLGTITERRLGVSVPHCNVEASVEWLDTGSGLLATLTWKGSNATNCELYLTSIHLTSTRQIAFETEKLTLPVSSSHRFSAVKILFVVLKLSGSRGTCTWNWFNFCPPARTPLPVFTLLETVEPQTGKLHVKWSAGMIVFFACNYYEGGASFADLPYHVEDQQSMEFARDFSRPHSLYALVQPGKSDSRGIPTMAMFWSTSRDLTALSEATPFKTLDRLMAMAAPPERQP